MNITLFGLAPDSLEHHATTPFERGCYDVLSALAGAATLAEVADVLFEHLGKALPLERLAWVRQAEEGALVQVAARAHHLLAWRQEMPARWRPSFTAPALQGSHMVVTDDLRQGLGAEDDTAAHWLVAEGMRSCLLLPCGPIEGCKTMLLLASKQTAAYGSAQVELVEGLAVPVRESLERARRYADLAAEVAGAGAYLATLSDELRTYLERMGSFADALAAGSADPETKWYAHEVAEGAYRLESLAGYSLDAAALTGDVSHLVKAPLDLAALAKDVFDDVSQDQRGGSDAGCLSFERCLGSEALPVVGDRVLLARALHALLDNACKFTDAPGKVSLAGGRKEGVAWLEVSDTGRGLGATELPRIFDKYYQATRAPGSGLGLAMVKAVVSAHGGQIRVTSQPGMGSTFRLTLPLAEPGTG